MTGHMGSSKELLFPQELFLQKGNGRGQTVLYPGIKKTPSLFNINLELPQLAPESSM